MSIFFPGRCGWYVIGKECRKKNDERCRNILYTYEKNTLRHSLLPKNARTRRTYPVAKKSPEVLLPVTE